MNILTKIKISKGIIAQVILCLTALGVFLLIDYYNDQKLIEKLEEGSVYSVAHVTRVYTHRGWDKAVIKYQLSSETYTDDITVTIYKTKDKWAVDRKKLRKRRLLVRISSKDPNIYTIEWDYLIPDTVQHIPVHGWKQLPSWVIPAPNA